MKIRDFVDPRWKKVAVKKRPFGPYQTIKVDRPFHLRGKGYTLGITDDAAWLDILEKLDIGTRRALFSAEKKIKITWVGLVIHRRPFISTAKKESIRWDRFEYLFIGRSKKTGNTIWLFRRMHSPYKSLRSEWFYVPHPKEKVEEKLKGAVNVSWAACERFV
jgi:hypothetical protein